MEFLPKDLEDIIMDYKLQMEELQFNEELKDEINNIGFTICNDTEWFLISQEPKCH